MSENVKRDVESVLKSKMHMRIATVTPSGAPLVRTV